MARGRGRGRGRPGRPKSVGRGKKLSSTENSFDNNKSNSIDQQSENEEDLVNTEYNDFNEDNEFIENKEIDDNSSNSSESDIVIPRKNRKEELTTLGIEATGEFAFHLGKIRKAS